ncbi:MAG TPA: hypothetical protein VFX30_15095 [bacterium]|nr:hypothetical protein [bacterium]
MSRRRLIGVLCCLAWAFSTRAASVLPLSLSQLTGQAGRIFVGTCVSLTTDLDENGIPATYARFAVSDGVKGAASGETILIKQFGTSRAPLKVGEGESAVVPMKTISLAASPYEAGKDYLLFLYPESDLGFTSPVGAGQGRFEIQSPSQAGLKTASAVNPLNNRFLETFREGPVALPEMVKKIKEMVGP